MHRSRKPAYLQGYREFESLPVRFFGPPSHTGTAASFFVSARQQGSTCIGQVAERLKAHAWKACIRESVSRVRIPLCPWNHKSRLHRAVQTGFLRVTVTRPGVAIPQREHGTCVRRANACGTARQPHPIVRHDMCAQSGDRSPLSPSHTCHSYASARP